MAEECLEKANDLSGLLLLHSAHGSAAGLAALVGKAEAAGRLNVAFLCQLLAGRLDACVDLLLAAGRIPEAAFFARTYLPSRISEARRPIHSETLSRGTWWALRCCHRCRRAPPMPRVAVLLSPEVVLGLGGCATSRLSTPCKQNPSEQAHS